ncbi:unnamed protein product [Bursaphelenchus okinawaensis]|uniref:Neur_chan_LBD domain-containing protein n=1 Tax=Bursaphelenchus okinawaensis TaxID=465554 RepID=A0A811L124_9BILA|nr:unnamed protein product [Bursaphelenchus okinawaensis]CAG9115587.1 unnamed protein product [Bursaphelenchus okinawaensis]
MLKSILLLLLSITCVKAGPSELLDHILNKYDKRVRPFIDDGRPVEIQMTIVLAILTELHENNQVASFVISHVQKWVDPNLVWNPAEYGIDQLTVPQSLVWVPKMFIYNSMDTKDMLTENRYDIRLKHDGNIKVNIPQYVTCICKLQIDLFPFDTQFCAIAQASPLLNINEMVVNATQPPKDAYFAGNAEWEVMNVTVRHMKFMEDGEYRVEVHYILHLHRRPIYYLTVIVAPTFLISALSILGIFSPGDSDGPRGEKVSLGLGSLLAMVVLLDIVANAMPKSNSIPLLGYYIIAVILLCALGVGISMAMLGISRSMIESENMPSQMAYSMVFMKRPKHFMDYWERMSVLEQMENDIHVAPPKFPDLIALFSRVQEIADAQIAFRKKIEKQKWLASVEKEWNRIFARYDYLFLLIFQVLNLVVLMLFLRFSWLPIPELPTEFVV